MATTILAQHQQYELPETDRQAILAQSPRAQLSARLSARIEAQRQAFMEANGGDPFGQQYGPDGE